MKTTESFRKESKINGYFFIAAAVTSIIGLKLYDPILQNKDFIFQASNNPNTIVLGALFELFLVISAVGTGIMMYPVLKKNHTCVALAYLCFRILEVVFIMIGTLSILTILSIAILVQNGTIQNPLLANEIGKIFIAVHDWTFILGPNFMLAINTMIYSIAFFYSNVIPKKLAAYGIFAATCIMLAALLELFGIIAQISTYGIALAIPIASYEMIFAVRLIWKGFTIKF